MVGFASWLYQARLADGLVIKIVLLRKRSGAMRMKTRMDDEDRDSWIGDAACAALPSPSDFDETSRATSGVRMGTSFSPLSIETEAERRRAAADGGQSRRLPTSMGTFFDFFRERRAIPL